MSWHPHVTVATVVSDGERYLMVHEHSDTGAVYNQPAGHLEPNETLAEAAVRETLEETGWEVALKGILGIGQYTSPHNGITYIRVSFAARPVRPVESATLDHGIIEAVWLTDQEIATKPLRSPMVLNDLRRHASGKVYPLELSEHIQVK